MAKHGIKYKNVINLDQVPQYFEVENGSTITTRGSKQVILRKGGTSHKRFTSTFAITTAGEFLKSHLLFSKLVNRPRVPSGVLCDVNLSGMWNEEILWTFIKNSILCRRETAFSREPVLLILDSYGCHVNLVQSDRLKAYNVCTILVPERLTSVMQPLDVGINRGFQSHYASRYDKYLSEALENPDLQTANGNPKVPNYTEVAQWVLEWIASMDRGRVKKSFLLCGLLQDDFSLESLHKPLQDLLSGDYSVQEWAQQHAELLELEEENSNQSYLPPRWHLPDITATSLFECVLVKLYRDSLAGRLPTSLELNSYREDLIDYMKSDQEFHDITDDDYFTELSSGRALPGELELFAICHKEKILVKVFDDGTKTSFTYTCDNVVGAMEVVRLDDYFAILMADES